MIAGSFDVLSGGEFSIAFIPFTIYDLADPTAKAVKGKTFTECILFGPGSAAFIQCNFAGAQGLSNCDAMPLKDYNGFYGAKNQIRFIGCTFVDCTFRELMLFITEDDWLTLEKASGGKLDLLMPFREGK